MVYGMHTMTCVNCGKRFDCTGAIDILCSEECKKEHEEKERKMLERVECNGCDKCRID